MHVERDRGQNYIEKADVKPSFESVARTLLGNSGIYICEQTKVYVAPVKQGGQKTFFSLLANVTPVASGRSQKRKKNAQGRDRTESILFLYAVREIPRSAAIKGQKHPLPKTPSTIGALLMDEQ